MENSLIITKLNNIEALLHQQEDRPFTLEEAARYIGISKSHLYKLTSEKKIPHYKPQNKKIYFEKTELKNWILTNRNSSEQELEAQANEYISGNKRGA